MEAVLDHDYPKGPTTKAGMKAAQNTLLSAKRREQQLAITRHRLLEAIRRTEEEIQDELDAKKRLAHQARELRLQMEQLATLSDGLAKEKTRQAAYVAKEREHFEKRREPLSTKPNDGLLNQLGKESMNLVDYADRRKQQQHASSRRTGFVTDYQGRMYLGGGSRKSETQMHKEAMQTIERRRAEEKRRLQEESDDAALNVSRGANQLPLLNLAKNNNSSSAPLSPSATTASMMLSGANTANSKKSGFASTRRGDTSPNATARKYDGTTVFGKVSQVDLDKSKGMSSKRTRYYTDYAGKRVAMDPNDWPRNDGLLLL